MIFLCVWVCVKFVFTKFLMFCCCFCWSQKKKFQPFFFVFLAFLLLHNFYFHFFCALQATIFFCSFYIFSIHSFIDSFFSPFLQQKQQQQKSNENSAPIFSWLLIDYKWHSIVNVYIFQLEKKLYMAFNLGTNSVCCVAGNLFFLIKMKNNHV